MRNQEILLSLLATLAVTGCKQIECGEGTVERDGICAPGNGSFQDPICGEGTMLVGDRCEPVYPPTECDPESTEPMFDETTGVTTCKGQSGSLACTDPSSPTKQTVCGQLYDFETNQPLAAADATGALCDPLTPTADGPCALTIVVYDAISFASDPMNAEPVPIGKLEINDKGQFRIKDIDTNMVQLYIGLGVDDANKTMGPDGYAVTSAIAFNKTPGKATSGFEHWLVKPSTAGAWASSGGPTLQTGVYAGVFRAHKVGVGDPFANQSGVSLVAGQGTPNKYYFEAAETDRTNVDTGATMTGANGTALATNVMQLSSGWTGSGGITDTTNCRWDSHVAAALPGVVFIQLFRKTDQIGKTCAE